MRRLEVRCCCVPKKLLGWLPVEEDKIQEGATIVFTVPPRARLAPLWAGDGPAVDRSDACQVRLPIALFQVSEIVELDVPGVSGFELEVDSHLALKSEETPLETLRQIPGFIENLEGPDGSNAPL